MTKHQFKPQLPRHRPATIHVVVVDDSVVARTALVRHLASTPGVEVVGEAENGVDAFHLVACLQPDLVITDLQMPAMDGLQLVKGLREKFPAMRFILCSAHDGPTCEAVSLQHGAHAFLPKHDLPHQLRRTIARLFPGDQPPAIQETKNNV